MSSSTSSPMNVKPPDEQSQSQPASSKPSSHDLFSHATQTLPKDRPIIFVNLLRLRSEATYPTTLPSSILSSKFATPLPDTTPCSGQVAYFERYFPAYHAAARDVYGAEEAEAVQRVLYKGAPLLPLKFAEGRRSEQGYWNAVVMTRCASWEVVQRISTSERYVTVGKLHREAAVEDDELFVSCAVDGFEFPA